MLLPSLFLYFRQCSAKAFLTRQEFLRFLLCSELRASVEAGGGCNASFTCGCLRARAGVTVEDL